MRKDTFRNSFGRNIFHHKYAQGPDDSWSQLAYRVVDDVCGTMGGKEHPIMSKDEREFLVQCITDMKFIPGGRYLYYAGRDFHAYNNCYLLRAEEDTREEWAAVVQRAMACLITGGGIGIDYSRLRPSGRMLKRTGGKASGPIPLMFAVNEIGRNVQQGGSRRSAIYASLNWQHEDAQQFLTVKDWDKLPIGTDGMTVWGAKQSNFNFPAPLDMTNISLNYDDEWLKNPDRAKHPTFLKNVAQALRSGEPGFSFNFGTKQNETLRNAPVTAETMVLTAGGYRAVRDLVDTPVTVWTGKQWAPDVVFTQTSPQADIVKVTFTGGREIRCDTEHPFLVERYRGAGKRRQLSSIERVPAQDLEPGDILHVSLPSVVAGESRDVDSYTLGYLYGDGCFNGPGNADVSFCGDDKLPCLDIVRTASRISSVTEKDGRGFTRAYFKVDADYFGDRSKDTFPAELFGASVEAQTSFLAGLFDADGNYDASQHRIRLSSNHEGFLRDTARLLEQLGILAGVNRNGRSTYGQKQTYSLVVMADYVSLFARIIPTARLAISVDGWEPYRPSTIKVESVTPDGVEPVYCADVKVDEHTFMAEGVIISNCCEITSEDDSDVCNLGSVNLAAIESLEELRQVTYVASKFLVCGTLRADLPYEKVYKVREKNRRLGMGLMGMHEWLLKRNQRYEVTPELRTWLAAWKEESERGANEHCDRYYLNRPAGYRAIAPTGTIGIMAGTTTGIEPVFAVAYKRRYLVDATIWKYEYVVDATAQALIDLGINPDKIESAIDLADDFERRIAFQADVQEYVDHAISSTINLPQWGSELNNEDKIESFAKTLSKYAPRLRGFTCYPDGSRGGQPLVPVSYAEASSFQGMTFEENDSCKSGVCGI